MWFRFAVVAVKVAGPKKAAHVFLKRSYNGGAFEVSDASLGAFCLPLGADSQTPKDRMAQEVRGGGAGMRAAAGLGVCGGRWGTRERALPPLFDGGWQMRRGPHGGGARLHCRRLR